MNIHRTRQAIAIFESGAILQYLARKSGKFYGADARQQSEIEQWLFWQMGGLGPMAGQAHHFRSYAQKIEPDPSHPDWIITIHGEGYMLAELSDR